MGTLGRDESDSLLPIFEHSRVGFASTSLDGTLLRVDDRFCAIIGAPRAALVGKRLPDLALAEDQSIAQAMLDQLLTGGTPDPIRQRYQRAEGLVISTDINLALIHDADDHPMQFIVLMQDVTRLSRFWQQVQTSRQKLHLALGAAQLGVWQWDILLDQWELSDIGCAYFGMSPGALISREELLIKVHEEDRERVAHALAKSLATIGHYDEEFRVLWPDGSEH